MNPTTAQVTRDGVSFQAAVMTACQQHRRRRLGRATHCAVNPGEPGRVASIGKVRIVAAPIVPLGQAWAYREI